MIKTLLFIVTFIPGINQGNLKQTDSIAETWNLLVFEKGGCLGGCQYVKEEKIEKKEVRTLVFSQQAWKDFLNKDKTKLTHFLIGEMSDTTQTRIHTCPFFEATAGEMAVYSLQRIHQKNWFDFPEFITYKDREMESATEQPQAWLQEILKNKTQREKLEALYHNELKK
ncbi:hypothetical protein [Parvicella tangerina]|uniref:Uncharacterized protein n=1 Tax=Parvicella tangerina TaxID=2829795 RepID=A0A916NJN6_9FLAO|nr:hypothetical protein [Parvicella tangerina]CAG5087214.1 hypothetical protein CRYO30217_03418 [Parvicella tangerina]